MGSSRQEDRSIGNNLGSGISLPQWIKGKIDTRYDFDDNAFSPPSQDDGFFFIRYSKPQQQTPQPVSEEYKSIKEALKDKNITGSTKQLTSGQVAPPNFKEVKEIDFSKHPIECQPFVPTANKGEGKLTKPLSGGQIKLKSQGTDDGFHGEPALCGKSIVHVANQIMTSKFSKLHGTEMPSSDHESEMIKKGSKSLPATPLASPMTSPDSSPKARRKHGNRYFGGTFVPDREKYQGGWILQSIFGQSREITSKIEEEDEGTLDVAPATKNLHRKKSISSQNLTYIGKEEKATNSAVYTNVFQTESSEFREMNFWSPTSM